ncbi:hypothetical protein VWM83_09250, partial [Campylobacter coli]
NIAGDLALSDPNLFDYNKQLAFAIFSKYLLAFEFIAILLLIAIFFIYFTQPKNFFFYSIFKE